MFNPSLLTLIFCFAVLYKYAGHRRRVAQRMADSMMDRSSGGPKPRSSNDQRSPYSEARQKKAAEKPETDDGEKDVSDVSYISTERF